MLTNVLRTILPRSMRIRLRQVPLARWALHRMVGGVRCKSFPNSHYRFWYDGYRNIGFDAVELEVHEHDERSRVMEILADRPPRVAWDVGANVGFWSLFLSVAFPQMEELRCYEPDPVNLALLRKNRDENGLARWVVRPIGLSHYSGTATFYVDPETGATGSLERGADFIGKYYKLQRHEITVDLTTVDLEVGAGAAAPDFMKIDVEGHELAVFRGATGTLRQFRPVIIFEATRHGDEVAALLRDLDYDLYDLRGERLEVPAESTLALAREMRLS